MKNLLGFGIVTVILLFLFYYQSVNRENELLTPILLKNSDESIENFEIDYIDYKIYLKIMLRKPTSCKKVIELLKIDEINIRNRTYTPVCSKIGNDLIQIVYSSDDKS